MRAPIVLVSAVLFAVLGPRVSGPQSRQANAPFVYEPPEGFREVRDLPKLLEGGAGAKAWAGPETGGLRLLRPVVNQSHSSKAMPVEEADLGKLAQDMPKAFEGSGCTWVHRRHELRVRSDRARVGLIEGDCNHEIDLTTVGGSSKVVKLRKLQLLFPDDAGTSIVTASYATEEAPKWEPIFEATIATAKGVSVRAPNPESGVYAAWGAAGAVLGALLAALLRRGGKMPPVPGKATKEASDPGRNEPARDKA